MMNLKQVFMVCGLAISTTASAFQPVNFNVAEDAPWQKNAGGYTISYSGENYPTLEIAADVKQNTYYLLEFQSRMEGKQSLNISFLQSGTTCEPSTEFAHITRYWFSGNNSKIKCRIYLNPGPKAIVEVKDISLQELAESDLKKNLLPECEFESNAFKTFWERGGWGDPVYGGSSEASPAFLKGEKSLCFIKPEVKKESALVSASMPVIPGSNIILTFWAKADQRQSLRLNFDFQSITGIGGDHLYQLKEIALGTEWQEYSFEYTVPADKTKYPALAEQMLRIHLQRTNAPGNIWIDSMEFKQK